MDERSRESPAQNATAPVLLQDEGFRGATLSPSHLGFPGAQMVKRTAQPPVGDLGLTLVRKTLRRNGYSPYSCSEDFRDRGAWQATVYKLRESEATTRPSGASISKSS